MKVADRIQLAEDISESIVAFPEALPLTEAQRKELDHRRETFAANPEAGIPWNELKGKLLKSQ